MLPPSQFGQGFPTVIPAVPSLDVADPVHEPPAMDAPLDAEGDANAPRRSPYIPPLVRASKRLSPVLGSALTPVEVAAARQPMLLRAWAMGEGVAEGGAEGGPAAGAGRPREGGVVGSLVGLRSWSEERLREDFDGWGLVRVRGQWDSPVFKLSAKSALQPREGGAGSLDGPLNGAGGADTPGNPEAYDGLPLGLFFDGATDDRAPYCYYTAPLEDWSPVAGGALAADAGGWRGLQVRDTDVAELTAHGKAGGAAETSASGGGDVGSSGDGGGNGDDGGGASGLPEPMAMVWLSHPQVTAQAHFDRSHNFLSQVVGSKRAVLWEPSQWSRLYPHPASSEHKQQSQVGQGVGWSTATALSFAPARHRSFAYGCSSFTTAPRACCCCPAIFGLPCRSTSRDRTACGSPTSSRATAWRCCSSPATRCTSRPSGGTASRPSHRQRRVGTAVVLAAAVAAVVAAAKAAARG